MMKPLRGLTTTSVVLEISCTMRAASRLGDAHRRPEDPPKSS